MAKAKKNEEFTLAELVLDYYDKKNIADKYKKEVDEKNKKIKELMTADDSLIVEDDKKTNNRIYRVDGIVANYYEQVNKSFNEEGLAQFLKEKGYTQAIKTVEVVDMDILEKLIYNGDVKKSDIKGMQKFEQFKHIPKLTVKVDKE